MSCRGVSYSDFVGVFDLADDLSPYISTDEERKNVLSCPNQKIESVHEIFPQNLSIKLKWAGSYLLS